MAAMRWIDHWVGLPLCFLLGLCVALVRRLGIHRSRRIGGQRTLAVFKFFGLGSIIEISPLLRAIRARYPRARLAFVTFAENEHLVRMLGLCTDVRVIRTQRPLDFALDVLRQIAWLQRERVEAVIDLEFFSKFSTLLSFFSGARVRVGFHLNDFWRYSLITHAIYFNYYQHITDVYREAARRLDVMIDDMTLSRLDAGPAPRRAAREILTRHGWSPGAPLVGVNVNAGDMSLERRWPLERFAVVVQALLERHADLFVVLVGAPSERAYVLALSERLPQELQARVAIAAGQWTLDEFIAALADCDLFITNDSGPMHLAAAQGVPLLSLWGPGRPGFYAPRSADHHAIYNDFPCSPCLYMFTTFEGMWCNHEGWCMLTITPDAVLAAAEPLLGAARQRRAACPSTSAPDFVAEP
jgi:ADP-heptose:LPS heptosyltransferase